MKKFLRHNDASKFLKTLGKEFIVVQNPNYIFPPYEIYPLAPKQKSLKKLFGIVMDMDGTTTTTEEICIHSLEYMVRQITNRLDKNSWAGLDHHNDYPHIIGNSTTRHVEYLIKTYESNILSPSLIKSFLYSVLWTLLIGKDESRKVDVKNNLFSLGLINLLDDIRFRQLQETRKIDSNLLSRHLSYFVNKYSNKIELHSLNKIVRASIDIYYQRYHEILQSISQGKSVNLAEKILGDKTKRLIEPLPGVAIFLALVKGLLGNEAQNLSQLLYLEYLKKIPSSNEKIPLQQISNVLKELSNKFEQNPVKVGIVTSSIFYEANIVLSEVFKVIKLQIESWDISKRRKEKILNKFSSYENFYDGVVTASDSNEIRLKPHRDLYSIALNKLSISPKDYNKVIGFEDSESGTTAIRSSGIGLCVAVPFPQTKGHDLSSASFILKGGLPEAIIKHKLFLKG